MLCSGWGKISFRRINGGVGYLRLASDDIPTNTKWIPTVSTCERDGAGLMSRKSVSDCI